ncbi:metallo-dependent phosphatase-like protein [Vibrio phage 1.031.O._10N.261.46.F8]|nr:metallo-dependent phosphatase-like protein [Vibrio phage 1.031.O._10N.261.46.F8]
MAGKTFNLADPHWGHEKIWSPRGFSSMQEHDDVIMESCIETVGRGDTLILGGDICFQGGSYLDDLVARHLPKKFSKGRGFTVRNTMGNHDKMRLQNVEFIDTHHAYVTKVVNIGDEKVSVICSHIPVHPTELSINGGRWDVNIHGHKHDEILDQPQYQNACWERHTRPVLIDELVRHYLDSLTLEES